ncbi:MAG: hypothetical protein K0R57_6514 [Paenibacillaceae bacterium]|jgi:hypothetical protein|nr:hypothetical protein [Paenibacillaceae bacterium]
MPDSNSSEKVYLLPQTIGYYQLELTRLLEFERYNEAMEMLGFLLNCETGDDRAKEEWQSLLDWMHTMLPEPTVLTAEENELSEEELFLMNIRERASREPDYVEKLLDVFRRPEAWDKQVLALEQLRYLQHPRIQEVLLQWLQSRALPPILQFRTMQILKLRGEKGAVRLRRNGKSYLVDIRDVPASQDEFPLPLQDVLRRVLQSGLKDGIPLETFADQTWSEFVAYAFGTPLYMELLGEPLEARAAWAAAFHYTLLLTAQGTASAEEIKDAYGLTEAVESKWDRAVKVFGDFIRSVFPALL